MIRLSKYLWVLVFSTFVFPSCKIFKHKRSKKNKTEAVAKAQQIDSAATALKNVVIVDSALEENKVLIAETAAIWQKKITVKTFSTKARMHYEASDKSYDFVANIRMKTDSIIWVSVTVAGIVQVARAILTPDSFKAVVYTENTAFQGPIEKMNDFLPAGLDFYSFQNLLLGNPILRNASPQSVTVETPNWLMRFTEKDYIEQLIIAQNDSTLGRSQLLVQGNTTRTLVQNFQQYQTINEQKISSQRAVNILNNNEAILVEMNLSNIVLDAELSYPFSIPSHYTLK